ncbi:MAG: hypothetical protein QXX30_03445 [Candidatus Aenigmatarchaeota archaeon]
MLNNCIILAVDEKYHEGVEVEAIKNKLKDIVEHTSVEEKLSKAEEFLKYIDKKVKSMTKEIDSFYLLSSRLLKEYYRKQNLDIGKQVIPELTAIYILYTRAGESILDTLNIEPEDKKFIWEFIKFVGSYLKDKEESNYEERVRKYEAKMKPIETNERESTAKKKEQTKNESRCIRKVLEVLEQVKMLIKKIKQKISMKYVLIVIIGIGVVAITILILRKLFST